MNLVTIVPCDINAKETINFIFTNQIMDKNNTAYHCLLVLLNTSVGSTDPLVRNVFEKYYHPFNEPQLLYDTEDSKHTINRQSVFLLKFCQLKK